MSNPAARRWTLALFVAMAILQAVPVWSVRYLPMGDGPTHLYNAWVLHGLATDSAPPHIERAYRIDWRPHPNWTGHALMALFLTIVPPLVAEKLLVTLILATLYAGAWLLTTSVDPRADVYAFLVFPFTYVQTLMAGYYNFSLSVGLFLILLAVWWRRRDAPRPRTIAILAALLLLCYFTHIQATVLACASIVVLSVLTRRFALGLAILPVVPLLAFFGRTEQSNTAAAIEPGIDWEAARLLGRAEAMHSLGNGQLWLAKVVVAVYAVLLVVTLIRERRREVNLLAALAAIFAAMMFWLPAAAGTRDLFTQRNSLFVFLTLAAWFTPRIAGVWRNVLLAVLVAIAVANAAIHLDWFRRLGRDLAAWVRVFDVIEPRTTLLPLYFTPSPSPSMVDVYIHAISYVALEKELIDYANYEPGTNYFPIALRSEAVNPAEVERTPHSVDVARHAPHAEYVVTRGLTRDMPQWRDLEHLYRRVHESGELRIHRRKAPLANHELVLLPLLGTVEDVSAAGGARWRVDQRIINRGAAPVRVVFRNCLEMMPCELTVKDSVPVASTERFAFLHVPRDASLEITTIVRRADVERPELSIALPAPREREFTAGGARIDNVTVRGRKVGLRFYVFADEAWVAIPLRLRSRATGAIVAQRVIDVAGYDLFYNTDIRTDFPDIERKAEAVDFEIDAPPHARVWGFVTEADDAGVTRVVPSRAITLR